MISRYLKRSICVFVAGATVTLAYGWHMHRVRAAERETMDLGRGVQVYLGEPKADALAAVLSAGYSVAPVEAYSNSFAVKHRNSSGIDDSVVALLTFSPNLVFINKLLTPDDSSDCAFAKAIFYASRG